MKIKLTFWNLGFALALLGMVPLAHSSPIGNSYYNIAIALSKEVNAGNASCVVYATRLEILDAIQKANAHNDELANKLRASAEVQKAVGKLLSFRVVMDDLSLSDLKSLNVALPGSSFFGAERGNYGPEKVISFLPQGSLRFDSLVENGPTLKKNSEMGNWKLEGDGKNPAKIKIKITMGGKTHSYSIRELNERNGPVELGLVAFDSENSAEILSEIPSDCP